MHADIRQLIAFRDGEPMDVAVAEHVQACNACLRELSHYGQLKAALQELPAVPPPIDSWPLIAERRQLECAPQAARRSNAGYAAAVAASLVVALTAGILLHQPSEQTVGTSSGEEGVANLQQRSRELEYLLQRYGTPVVMSMRTAGAISELEDGIALIDYQLNASGDPKREHDLWQQRVELMETLVTVRAAETYIDSI